MSEIISLKKLADISAFPDHTKKQFSAGMAVAAGVVMVEVDVVIITHHVQVMPYLGMHSSAHLHGAGIGSSFMPRNAVTLQTALQHR